MPTNVLLFGATGRTGLEVAKRLADRGDNCTAVVRPGADTANLETLEVNLLVGNPLEPATIEEVDEKIVDSFFEYDWSHKKYKRNKEIM